MARDAKRVSEPKRRGRSKRLRSKARAKPEPSAAADEQEELFNEPATPPRKPIVPVEEPVPSPQRVEDTAACGLPDEPQTRGSDLH
jgi:hypothetical protein